MWRISWLTVSLKNSFGEPGKKPAFVILTIVEFAMVAVGGCGTIQEWNKARLSSSWVMGQLEQRSMTAEEVEGEYFTLCMR
jgi:hypothetical protein